MKNQTIVNSLKAVLVMGTAFGFASSAWAASCCGGGSASSLVLPKFSQAMVDVSMDFENYDGFWKGDGSWSPDPAGSDLSQYRLNLGYAYRLAPRWQVSMSVPYVWNKNQYASFSRNTNGLGDTKVSIWYEQFDKVACVWKVKKWQNLIPAVYWGGTLILPTGTSQYNDVADNFDITGLGMYRFDANVLLDKTVYPWNMSLSANYGKYLERPVNREYGTYVEPYDKQRGDRFNSSLSFGYTHFTEEMQSLTGTIAYAYLREDEARIDGAIDTTSGLSKRSASATLAWASEDRNWVAKLTWSHALDREGWGENFPTTDVITVGVSHVLR